MLLRLRYSLCLDEFAVEQQLVDTELDDSHGLVVVVDHPEGIITDAAARVRLDSSGLRARVVSPGAHAAHQPRQRPSRREAERERLRGRGRRRRDRDAGDHQHRDEGLEETVGDGRAAGECVASGPHRAHQPPEGHVLAPSIATPGERHTACAHHDGLTHTGCAATPRRPPALSPPSLALLYPLPRGIVKETSTVTLNQALQTDRHYAPSIYH